MSKRKRLEEGIEKACAWYEDAVEKAAASRLGQLYVVLRPEKPKPCLQNILCECNKRSCRPVSSYTYWRRMKGL